MPRVGTLTIAFLTICLELACLPVGATLAGLIQIATPDIQPVGELSSTYQAQNRSIENPQQLQFELGLAEHLAIGVFRGFSPGETILNAELNVLDRNPLFVSVGSLGTEHLTENEPFLEAGYHTAETDVVAGIAWQHGGLYGIFGFNQYVAPRLAVLADYVSGAGPSNFLAAGINYDITPELSVNPAIFIRNTDHKGFGSISLTWNTRLW